MSIFSSHTEAILDGLREPIWYSRAADPKASAIVAAARAVAEAAPDCRGVEPVGHVSVPVADMAALQEALR